MIDGLRSTWMANGFGAAQAQQKALAATFGLVERHAAMLSYLDIFRLLMGVFLAMIPLILLLKKPSPSAGTETAVH